MIAFPTMLEGPATLAGMRVPPDPNNYSSDEFPHFHCFCVLQLHRPMKMDGEQWRNAEIIASIPEEQLREMTLSDFLAAGLEWQQ